MEAGARPVIEPHGESPEGVNVSSVADRAVASAESSTLIVVKLGGFSMLSVPRMSCTPPALPTLTVVRPSPTSEVVTPVASTSTVSPLPVLTVRLLVSAYS